MSLVQTLRFSLLTGRLGAVSRWKARRVDRLARRRLRRLVRLAAERSAFYREKYRGIDLSRFELGQLPPTTKEELRTHFDETVTDSRVRQEDVERFIVDPANLGRWFLGKYAVSRTSGSQGAPLLIVQDRRALEIMFGIMSARAGSTRPGVWMGLRRLVHPTRVAVVTQHRGFYPSGAAFEFMPELVGPFVRVEWLSSLQVDLIERLNDFQPHILVGYATVLDALALRTDRLHLKNLQQLGNSSEQLTRAARERIESTFRVPLLDHYGTGECLLLSEGCPTNGGAHVNADWAILEVVDTDYRPVPPGHLGKKVLVTNLANTVQPFIRYEVGDQVQMATTACQCGSRLPRIERIEGRLAELFWVRSAEGYRMLPGVLFHNAADGLGQVREWQAVQTDRNRIEIRLELLPNSSWRPEQLEIALKRKLHECGLPAEVAVDVQVKPALESDRITGKFRRMISQVGPPVDLVPREPARVA